MLLAIALVAFAGLGLPDGSNRLTLDRDGRVAINDHGNRRVTRLEAPH